MFAKLVLEGQINAALRFVSESSSGGVLPLTDDVMERSLLFGPIDDAIPETPYSEINGDMVRQAALRTKGAVGPSGIDANGFRRIMASKSFKQSSSRLCEAIATMTKILCTQYIDSSTIEPLKASRLIPLDKGKEAVRPIGVSKVIRRIIGKCVMMIAKEDVVEPSGSLQLCAGQNSGSEAAIHAMHAIFEADETDGMLLIDASNAFNALNRQAALHNIRVQCPIIATYAINRYRLSAGLFITGGQEILSAEGTTQGDPLCCKFECLKCQVVCSLIRTQGCRKRQQGYLFHTKAVIPHKTSQQAHPRLVTTLDLRHTCIHTASPNIDATSVTLQSSMKGKMSLIHVWSLRLYSRISSWHFGPII